MRIFVAKVTCGTLAVLASSPMARGCERSGYKAANNVLEKNGQSRKRGMGELYQQQPGNRFIAPDGMASARPVTCRRYRYSVLMGSANIIGT